MKKILLSLLVVLAACSRENGQPLVSLAVILNPQGFCATRAGDPDDTRITDYNLYIFNAFGVLEERVFVPYRSLKLVDGKVQYNTTLLRDVPYTILAAANLGYELPFRTLEEARQYRYHMAYPDEFTQGIPMAAFVEEITLETGGSVYDLVLEHGLMTKEKLDEALDPKAMTASHDFIK